MSDRTESLPNVAIDSARGRRVISVREGARVSVGSRRGACDILVEGDAGLAEVHVVIRRERGIVTVEDAGTRTGTFVNGQRIRRHPLQDGDIVHASLVRISLALPDLVHVPHRNESVPLRTRVPVSASAKALAVAAGQEIAPAPVIAKEWSPQQSSSTDRAISILEWPADDPAIFRRSSGEHLFAVLDFARNRKIHKAVLRYPDKFESLYEGEQALQFTAVAPYLVEFDPDSGLFAFLRSAGKGDNWGIYVVSSADFPGLRRHLRRFLKVRVEALGAAYFRFYDPRVLRSFLPVCAKEQARELFGSVSAFIAETEDAERSRRFEFVAASPTPAKLPGLRPRFQ